ncbi:MAG: hypothetical protein RMI94_02145 [Bryobacterales bacterium]|nr:hypothetical protein [Bryobacteraceae bacterium]MDW8129319.1 hypothetical protein [Bryobacterales bacterium]
MAGPNEDGQLPRPLPPQASRSRFLTALAAYLVLAALAGWTLDGMFRWAVWVFLAGLAVKTWAAWRAARMC